MPQLTKQQALDAGYTRYSYTRDGFSFIYPIENIQPHDFEGNNLWCAEKEPYYIPSISSELIAELLADQMCSEVGDETQDDTDDVYDIVKELDFTETANKINAALGHKKYYKLTEIEIIPDNQ